MAPASILDKQVFVRELLPQDLKFELETLREAEAVAVSTATLLFGRVHVRRRRRF
jgi:hypothetical protein